jgi:hypothetical protein
MAVVIGVKQQIKKYQIMQENNNYANINSKFSSNLIYLNTDLDTFSNATITFRNNYEFGYINNKISIYNSNNKIITADNDRIDFYKNSYYHSNLNVNNYFHTSNNITTFNNNIKLNLNNNSNNSFEIKFDDNRSIMKVQKDNTNINSSNLFTSNIYVDPSSTIYTNFIDSPNLQPVVIKNMAFAESLRLLSANVIQNIAIDNNIIFANLTDYKPGTPNYATYTPSNATLWSEYMADNNINAIDEYFSRPNISIIKYVEKDQNNNEIIGGSNIVEYRTSKLSTATTPSIPSLVHSVNNLGYISIGSNHNPDIPFKININPISSNIFQYRNLNDINKSCCINSNGFIHIGSIYPISPNQLTINKNSNIDSNNTNLISLNINTANYNYSNNLITVPFINNENYMNFIFNSSFLDLTTIQIIIDNHFIKNNILINNLNSPSSLYENTSLYNSTVFSDITPNIIIKFPGANTFKLKNKVSLNPHRFIFFLYPYSFSNSYEPDDTSNNFNKIVETITSIQGIVYFIEFYIYKYNYNYNYTGKYYPKYTNFINCSNNTNTSFSLSPLGNLGIGNDYLDTYNIYTSNALIYNINCKSIDNFPIKTISFCNCTLTTVNTIHTSNITSIYHNCISNISELSSNNNCIINSNLTIIGNANGKIRTNAPIIFNNNNQINDYVISIYGSNAISIINNTINVNPNIIINSTCSNSYPYLSLQNTSNTYKMSINNNNNFEITNKNNLKIIENNYLNNNVNLFDNNFCIFRDTESNVKIFMGDNAKKDDIAYYSYISDIGNNVSIKSCIYTYGNLDLRDAHEKPLINSYTDINQKIRIGIGTVNNDTNGIGMMIDLSTSFSSNITANQNIFLSGTILSISDSNLKTNIKKINNPLEKIDKINGYTYIRTDTSNAETGLIAQEVMQILPEVIAFENNHYNISYGNMCGLLVECIKELKEKIQSLEDKLSMIK